jgi:hypothetical protein
MILHATQYNVIEWSLTSDKGYGDPFNEVDVDVVVEGPDGRELRVPAFWAGEQTWRVRFAPPSAGTYRYRSECTDTSNPQLHGQTGELEVATYAGDNAALSHGKLRIADGARHLEHEDGTPFFWLGDTWWMALCRRLRWPGDLRALVADRVAKGFSVVQIVAGLYPDMPAFDQRGANEAGFPWERDYARINPSYFDMADLRIDWLAQSGLVTCIVGAWGYHLQWLGKDRMRQHWRNLIARYGAYPVVWCIAGETSMPYYLSESKDEDEAFLKEGWTELARYVRETDPYANPITVHPTRYGRDEVEDPAVMDFEMLQTGHFGRSNLSDAVDMMTESLAREPRMPVLVGEAGYDGMLETNREEAQRFLFWTSLLSGAAGHTYGANGIWQVNMDQEPYGKSPHGTSWGDLPWRDAYQLPASGQLGLGKRLLERYPWWQFEPHPEWVEPHHSDRDRHLPYAAGIPGEVTVVFIPNEAMRLAWEGGVSIKGIDADREWRGMFFNPKTGDSHVIEAVRPDANGGYLVPSPPIFQDWVVVLEAAQP